MKSGGAVAREARDTTGRGRWWVAVVVALGLGAVSLDTTVNVALPAITAALDAPVSVLQWIIIAYVLTTTGLVLGCGRLADLIGRRRVWIGGSFALGVALVGCGLARSVGWLVLARAFQAVGAAMMLASGAALVTAVFPEGERGRALGVLGLGASAGQAVGPLLGGALVSAFGWQAVFLGRAPLLLAVGLLSLRMLPRETQPGRRERFDGVGSVLLAAALVAGLLALNRAPLWGWAAPRTLALAMLAVVLLGGFIRRERTFVPPMIDVTLFRSGPFAVANIAGFLSSLAMFGVWLLLPYYLVNGRGFDALRAGVVLACVPAASALAAPVSGWLADRIGGRLLVVVGLLVEAGALLLLARIGLATPMLAVVCALLLLGVGLGVFQSPNQSTVMGAVPPGALGVASGMLSTARTLGVVSGTSILGAVYDARLPESDRTSFSPSAFGAAFVVAAAVALVAALVASSKFNVQSSDGGGPNFER